MTFKSEKYEYYAIDFSLTFINYLKEVNYEKTKVKKLTN